MADSDTTAGTVGWEGAPSHYKGEGGVQNFDVIDVYNLGFYDGNALKYLLRAGRKGSRVNDLKKALHYVEETIIRWERGDITHDPSKTRWSELTTATVSIAFGMNRTGYVGSALFYLLSWRSDTRPDYDIRAAARYIERAIKELES